MAGFLEAQAAEQWDKLQELTKEVSTRRVRGESADGMVTAIVLVTGQVVDFEINARVYRNPDSRGLANSLVEAIGNAVAAAADERLTGLAELTGMPVESFQELAAGIEEFAQTMADEIRDGRG